VLYVGDSKVDETAAKAAQVPLVAYDNKSLSAAEYHIRSLKEIEGILEI
jgi:phosphoglycolate phosphatase-like HAD superfamily hydrolase